AIGLLSAELLDHRIMGFRTDQIARLTLRWPDRTFSYKRRARPSASQGLWEPEEGTDASAFEGGKLDTLATALSNLICVPFVQYQGPIAPEAGLAPPRLTVELELSGKAGRWFLKIGGRTAEKVVYATDAEGSEGAVFFLPEAGWDQYLPRPPVGVVP